MGNLYLDSCTKYLSQTQSSSGLLRFLKKDVSSNSGCINRVLRSTFRYSPYKPMRLQTVIASIAMLVGTAVAAQTQSQTSEETGSAGVGYPTVAEAMASLKAKPGVQVQITKPDAWMIANEPIGIQWSFVPITHYANPAVVRREVKVNREGDVFIEMRALCEAEKAQCDRLIEEFKGLNENMRQSIQSRLKSGQGTK